MRYNIINIWFNQSYENRSLSSILFYAQFDLYILVKENISNVKHPIK